MQLAADDSIIRVMAVRIQQEPIEVAIRRLERRVERYERRYGCSPQEMYDAIEVEPTRETADIARWLMDYRVLGHLQQKML